VIEPFSIPSQWRVYRFYDFGATNPFVCLWVARSGDDDWYVIDEHYQSGWPISKHAEAILSRQVWLIEDDIGDPEGAQAILDLRSHGISIRQGNNAVQQGINAVRELLLPGPSGLPRLRVFSSCMNIRREFESYSYKESTEGVLIKDQPVKVDDHAMDALRYGILKLQTSTLGLDVT
jgi:phage terminase large subunit